MRGRANTRSPAPNRGAREGRTDNTDSPKPKFTDVLHEMRRVNADIAPPYVRTILGLQTPDRTFNFDDCVKKVGSRKGCLACIEPHALRECPHRSKPEVRNWVSQFFKLRDEMADAQMQA